MFLNALILGSVLSWSPPDGKAPDGYIVYAGEGSRAYESSIDVGLDTTFALDGYLLDGRIFFLAVTAYNIYGESNYGNEVSVLITSLDGVFPSTERIGMFPNPFNNSLSIEAELDCKLEVFNVLGQKLWTLIIRKGQRETLDTRYLSSGAYFFRFQIIGSNEWRVMRGLKR